LTGRIPKKIQRIKHFDWENRTYQICNLIFLPSSSMVRILKSIPNQRYFQFDQQNKNPLITNCWNKSCAECWITETQKHTCLFNHQYQKIGFKKKIFLLCQHHYHLNKQNFNEGEEKNNNNKYFIYQSKVI
jgi:hypothetical protein